MRQIKRTQYLSLFSWLKIGLNVPDETHHVTVNVLSFFGLGILYISEGTVYTISSSYSMVSLGSVWTLLLARHVLQSDG